MMALVNAAQQSDYPADIRLVISNKPEAEGLRRADAAGVKALAYRPQRLRDTRGVRARIGRGAERP